jgi:hypothetical protein
MDVSSEGPSSRVMGVTAVNTCLHDQIYKFYANGLLSHRLSSTILTLPIFLFNPPCQIINSENYIIQRKINSIYENINLARLLYFYVLVKSEFPQIVPLL